MGRCSEIHDEARFTSVVLNLIGFMDCSSQVGLVEDFWRSGMPGEFIYSEDENM
jgi:hypothetical protein